MKTLLLATLIATTVNSCDDSTVVTRMTQESERARTLCINVGGVPITEPVLDAGTWTYNFRVIRCDIVPYTKER